MYDRLMTATPDRCTCTGHYTMLRDAVTYRAACDRNIANTVETAIDRGNNDRHDREKNDLNVHSNVMVI